MNILELFKRSEILTHGNAPGLMQSIEELAAQGKARMPKVRLARIGQVNAAFHPFTNTLFVTDDILKVMGSADLAKPASREMSAVLAHEMGHVRFKFSQFAPVVGICVALPTVALAATYLLEKTHARVKEAKHKDPENPKHFWSEFGEVTKEAKQNSWATFKDFIAYMHPSYSKAMKMGRYKDEKWSKVLLEDAKIAAIGALMIAPAFAACRPISLRNEWQSDRFMLALTQDKEACLSAFNKLKDISATALKERAATPIQRTFGERIIRSFEKFLANTVMAHPPLKERISFIERANVADITRSFHL